MRKNGFMCQGSPSIVYAFMQSTATARASGIGADYFPNNSTRFERASVANAGK
jgi:hypothetical protein